MKASISLAILALITTGAIAGELQRAASEQMLRVMRVQIPRSEVARRLDDIGAQVRQIQAAVAEQEKKREAAK